ncbi:MAG: GGDEF domain-containing protein [Deltaproteobacteria bacterium]|nr:GGDEF domain-containing protein [Deltaproteobacteria bacterium]
MKLKGKLIVSFTTVVVVTLVTFAAITYYSFASSINERTSNIVELQAEKTILTTHSRLHHKVIDLLNRLAPNINRLLSHKIAAKDAGQLLENLAAKEPLVNAVYLYRNTARDLIPASAMHNMPLLAKKLTTINAARDGVWFMAGSRLYLLFLMNQLREESSFIIEVNQDYLRNLLNSSFTINGSVIYLSQNNRLFIPPVTGSHHQTSLPDLEAVSSFIGKGVKEGQIVPYGKVYRPANKLFGTRVTFFVPNNFYNANLISLKDRLITAILIIGWCAIWIILILANSITNPIRKLTELVKDIISFDYSSELEIKPGKDEIGELAVNFETMRLKIKDLVTKDQLTHVYNRRFLMHVFELAVLKTLRLHEELCCIMLDIDYFKKINDTYGHQAGDTVLIEVSKTLLDQTRDYDTPARYGGEEFLLILPETDIKTAYEIAERIRKTIENQVFCFEGQRISCTTSIGVSRLDKDTANTTEQIIHNTDAALYKAKESGRNRTVIYRN